MKIFVCSDIHGNFRAFEAVLSEYRKGGPFEFLFLGDALGYGTHPDAVLDRLLGLPRSVLLFGNHEWSLVDRPKREEMNDIAAGSIVWSESMMEGRYDRRIGERFKLTAEGRGYIAAHSSPTNTAGVALRLYGRRRRRDLHESRFQGMFCRAHARPHGVYFQ